MVYSNRRLHTSTIRMGFVMTTIELKKKPCEKCGALDNMGRWTSDCAECRQRERIAVYENFCWRTYNGEPVTRKFVDSLAQAGTIDPKWAEAAHDLVAKSLIGPARKGKTLAAKCLYNQALYVQGPNKVFWIKEFDLFQKFRHDGSDGEESAHEWMQAFAKKRPRYVFIDEAFHEVNWSDRMAQRDKAKLAHMLYSHFVDGYLYEAEWKLELILTGNNSPESMIGMATENQRGLVGRFVEMAPLWTPKRIAS